MCHEGGIKTHLIVYYTINHTLTLAGKTYTHRKQKDTF